MADSLSVHQRARRLAGYLETISGDTPAEEYFQIADDEPALETLSKRDVRRSANALEKAVRGNELSALETVHAEAIIHKTRRPSHKIESNKFDPFSGEFHFLTKNIGVHKDIQQTFSAIGRIDFARRVSRQFSRNRRTTRLADRSEYSQHRAQLRSIASWFFQCVRGCS